MTALAASRFTAGVAWARYIIVVVLAVVATSVVPVSVRRLLLLSCFIARQVPDVLNNLYHFGELSHHSVSPPFK